MSAALAAAAPAHAASVEAEIEQQVTQKVTGLTKEVVSFFGFGGDQANNPTDPAPVAEAARTLTARAIEPMPVAHATIEAPAVPAVERDKPRTEKGLKKFFCVEYARLRSGLAVFGDARHWWDRARTLYARAAHPAEDAVMVFSGSKRLKRGHVAVVTEIVSPREIIVDHANWQNKREIDLATPVMDVSPNNDWSQVRVWDIPSGTFGARSYAISGFITKGLIRQARND
ncbi:MAG: CHAP domain-containing protein [Pseudomonadota bacterium]